MVLKNAYTLSENLRSRAGNLRYSIVYIGIIIKNALPS